MLGFVTKKGQNKKNILDIQCKIYIVYNVSHVISDSSVIGGILDDPVSLSISVFNAFLFIMHSNHIVCLVASLKIPR